jgi:hypothetical protein
VDCGLNVSECSDSVSGKFVHLERWVQRYILVIDKPKLLIL